MSDLMTSSRPIELFRALAVLAEPPAGRHASLAEALGLGAAPTPAAYTEAFVLGLSPFASVYLGQEGMIGGEARDRIAGFWRAVGHTPPPEPDHLSALLGLYASLAECSEGAASLASRSRAVEAESPADADTAAQAALAGRARDALLHEHLSPWLPLFLERVATAGGFYARWAPLLARALERELAAVPAPAPLPVHLLAAPPLPDPRTEGASAFLGGLLAPVRSGVIVTRADLVGIARTLGLGVRVGERRWVLEHLLALEPEAVLTALAEHARAAATHHATRPGTSAAVAAWWQTRAVATAILLDELAEVEAPAEAAPTR